MRPVRETLCQYLKMYRRDHIFRLASTIAILCVVIKLRNMWIYYEQHFLMPGDTKLQQDFCTKSQNECGVIPEGINMHPWLAQVTISVTIFGVDLLGVCGGVFISNQHVVTADHCVNGTEGYTHYINYNGNSYEAEVVANSPKTLISGRFLNGHIDMALLRLKTVPSGCVIPICLPTNNLIVNDNLTMANFRVFKLFSYYHEENISVIDGETCYRKYFSKNRTALNLAECDEKPKEWMEWVFEKSVYSLAVSLGHASRYEVKESEKLNFNFLCSGKQQILRGDSGSPLMQKDDNNIWTLIAIVRGKSHSQSVCFNDTLTWHYDYQTIFPQLSWVLESMKK